MSAVPVAGDLHQMQTWEQNQSTDQSPGKMSYQLHFSRNQALSCRSNTLVYLPSFTESSAFCFVGVPVHARIKTCAEKTALQKCWPLLCASVLLRVTQQMAVSDSLPLTEPSFVQIMLIVSIARLSKNYVTNTQVYKNTLLGTKHNRTLQ